MSNKSRQPKVEKAVGNPIQGAPASTLAVVANTGNRLQGKELDNGSVEGHKS